MWYNFAMLTQNEKSSNKSKIKTTIIAVPAVFIVYVPVLDLVNYIGFMQKPTVPYISTYFLAALSAILLVGLIICSIERPFRGMFTDIRAWLNKNLTPHEIKLGIANTFSNNRSRCIFAIVYFGIGIIITAQSYTYDLGMGMDEFALFLVFLFPALALVWRGRKDPNTLWKPIAWALVSIIPLIIILAAIATPLSTVDATSGARVLLLGLNPGVLARYIAAGIPAIYYLMYKKTGRVSWAIVTLPLSIGVIFMTGSRTTFLAIIAVTIVFLIAIIKRGRKMISEEACLRYIATRIVAILLSIVLSLPLTIAILSIGSNFESDDTMATLTRAEFIVKEVKHYSGLIFTRFGLNAVEDEKSINANRLSSGRLELWKAFLNKISLSGHDDSESPSFAGVEAYPNAHNAPLTIGFQCGIVAGILYLLLIIMSGIYVLRQIFRHGTMCGTKLFACMLITFYLPYPMLDPPLFPFDELPVMLFFLSVGFPLFGERKIVEK